MGWKPGAGLMGLAALAAFIAAAIDFLSQWGPIGFTPGALIVAASTLILVGLAVALLLRTRPDRVSGWLTGLSLVDILGTGLAAYFLHAWVILALMAAALLGWLADLAGIGAQRRRAPA